MDLLSPPEVFAADYVIKSIIISVWDPELLDSSFSDFPPTTLRSRTMSLRGLEPPECFCCGSTERYGSWWRPNLSRKQNIVTGLQVNKRGGGFCATGG